MDNSSPHRRRLASLAAAVAMLATTGVLVFAGGDAAASSTRTTGGAVPSYPCRDVTCTVSLAVGSHVVRWTSPQIFYPENEQVLGRFVASRTETTRLKSYGAQLCKHRFYGSAMSILVTACGTEAQITVKAVRLKRGLRRLTITYAADPFMSDGETGGGRSSSVYAGLTPLTGLSWN
jgi:hypothetical protein